jgi:UPF0176 protein
VVPFEANRNAFRCAIDRRPVPSSGFRAALQRHRGALEVKTIVSLCIGGICRATAALTTCQFDLDCVWRFAGGILKQCGDQGGAHFRGEGFVLDGREAR